MLDEGIQWYLSNVTEQPISFFPWKANQMITLEGNTKIPIMDIHVGNKLDYYRSLRPMGLLLDKQIIEEKPQVEEVKSEEMEVDSIIEVNHEPSYLDSDLEDDEEDDGREEDISKLFHETLPEPPKRKTTKKKTT